MMLADRNEFRPGVYRHYKGNHYLALGLARHDETEDVYVVYTRLYPRAGLPLSLRRLTIWQQWVNANGDTAYPDSPGCQPRFAYVGQAEGDSPF